jgi:hypothetical protein
MARGAAVKLLERSNYAVSHVEQVSALAFQVALASVELHLPAWRVVTDGGSSPAAAHAATTASDSELRRS